jgi:AcrR family transcriptional regulator
VRHKYRIDMGVSRQAVAPAEGFKTGPRARMRRVLLEAAMDLMQRGIIPSVSDLAEAAAVSRATAYRYFPSQASIIQDALHEALEPIRGWESSSGDPEERIADLLAFAYPHIETYEATHRAVLLLALDQWTRRKAGTLGDEEPVVRGNRKQLLAHAASPLRARIGRQAFDKLTQALSLIFGTEALIVLKDIWGLDGGEARRVAVWAANALVRAAAAESPSRNRIHAIAQPSGRPETGSRPAQEKGKKAALRPRRKSR